MKISVLLYDRFTALDRVGPYEVLARLPGGELTFVGEEARPYRADTGALAITADATLADARDTDVLLIPGGPGQAALIEHAPVLDWVREVHAHTTWTTSVCTGSPVLGAAGVLEGKRAVTHWAATDQLAALGATPVEERVVFDGKIVTAAGVSAGIDMALRLAAIVAGERLAQAVQLGIEYDPQPPFDAGSPTTAPPEIVAMLRGTVLR